VFWHPFLCFGVRYGNSRLVFEGLQERLQVCKSTTRPPPKHHERIRIEHPHSLTSGKRSCAPTDATISDHRLTTLQPSLSLLPSATSTNSLITPVTYPALVIGIFFSVHRPTSLCQGHKRPSYTTQGNLHLRSLVVKCFEFHATNPQYPNIRLLYWTATR
jgi:hypothetical protein